MIRPGMVAWASIAPGFSPPAPHPILCVMDHANGLVGIAYITHSADLLRASVPLTRREVPSAFRHCGGPLTDELSVVALVDHFGHRRIVNADPISDDRLRIGTAIVSLSHRPATRWRMATITECHSQGPWDVMRGGPNTLRHP